MILTKYIVVRRLSSLEADHLEQESCVAPHASFMGLVSPLNRSLPSENQVRHCNLKD